MGSAGLTLLPSGLTCEGRHTRLALLNHGKSLAGPGTINPAGKGNASISSVHWVRDWESWGVLGL